MLYVCRRLLRASVTSRETWRLLKQVPGLPRISSWRACWREMEITAEQPNTTQSVSVSVSQNIEPTPNAAHDNVEPIPHSEVEQVEGSCDKKSKSCDNEVSSSAATEVIRAQYAQEEGYEYLQRGHSTEIFKIVISNIHPKMGFSALRSNLKALKLAPAKIKKPPTATTCFVNFRSEEERQFALKALNGCVWKKKTISAKVAAPIKDPLYRKRKERSNDPEFLAKRARLATMTPEERLAEAVTPLLSTPYQEQLSGKESRVREFLKSIAKEHLHGQGRPDQWMWDHVANNDGLLCKLEPIKSSPIQSSYRNKCEFTVGLDAGTRQPVVGFRLSSYEEGDFTVVTARSCVHIPQHMKDIAQLFERYFMSSQLKPFDSRDDSGHWRQIAVRCYTSGESMAVLTLHPQTLTIEELSAEKQKLVDFFSSSEGSKIPLSLYVQELGRRGANWKPSYEHLLGPKHVHEDLMGLKFRISPDAFFQVNSPAAEVLYSRVGQLCDSTHTTPPVLYDICCGTGTIGLYLAKSLPFERVVGVEMVEQAIEDARVNAQINGVTNAEFICGKAEDVMPNMNHPLGLEVIGVVDPPRAGLHAKVVETIRKCATLKRLVYVSCHLEGARHNLLSLGRRMSHQFKGLPFRLVSATPIDLFPHTPHCEVVFLLERITKDELKTETKTIKANSMKKSETHEAATTDNMNPGSQEVEEITMCNVETESQYDKTTTDSIKSESPKVIASDSSSTSECVKIIDKAIGGDVVKSNPPKAKDSVKLCSSEVNVDCIQSESQEIEATGTGDGISDSQEVKLNSETVNRNITY